jgi:hypothetical protein
LADALQSIPKIRTLQNGGVQISALEFYRTVSNRTSFLLDASISTQSIISLLATGSAAVQTTVRRGLPKDADDLTVIDLAYHQRATLVTTDHGIVNKCRQYQLRTGACLFGLLVLPDGVENQRRILQDLKKGKQRLRFSKLDRSLTWSLVRDFNFLVRAQAAGHPHVLDLCDCRVWEETQ